MLEGEREREGEGGRERERDRERERERERERGRRRERERRLGRVLALMFEMSSSYLNASWWMVDSCMARLGEQGMPPGFDVQCTANSEVGKLLECLLVDGGFAHGETWRTRC